MTDFWLGVICGSVSTGLLTVSVAFVRGYRSLPPATRRELDRSARANRPRLPAPNKRNYDVDPFTDEDTYP